VDIFENGFCVNYKNWRRWWSIYKVSSPSNGLAPEYRVFSCFRGSMWMRIV